MMLEFCMILQAHTDHYMTTKLYPNFTQLQVRMSPYTHIYLTVHFIFDYIIFPTTTFTDCVRRQYSNYTIGDPNGDTSKFFRVDGNITLGENIAAKMPFELKLANQNIETSFFIKALKNVRAVNINTSNKLF